MISDGFLAGPRGLWMGSVLLSHGVNGAVETFQVAHMATDTEWTTKGTG